MARPTDVPTDRPDAEPEEQPVVPEGTAEPGPEADEAPAARGRSRPPWSLAIAGWIVAVIATAAGVTFGLWWAPLHFEAQDREAVQDTAQALVMRLTTFEGANIEQWVTGTQELSTGDYADEVAVLFDQGFREALREAEAVSRGEVIDLFVQDIDGDEAVVFAVARQTIVNRNLDDPVQDELRMEIVLQRVDGTWLVSDVAVLPGGGPQRAPGADLEAIEP